MTNYLFSAENHVQDNEAECRSLELLSCRLVVYAAWIPVFGVRIHDSSPWSKNVFLELPYAVFTNVTDYVLEDVLHSRGRTRQGVTHRGCALQQLRTYEDHLVYGLLSL